MRRITVILLSLTLSLILSTSVFASNQYVQRQSDTIPEVELLQSQQLLEAASQDKLENPEYEPSIAPELLNVFGWFEANDNINTASDYAAVGYETQMTLGSSGSGKALQTLKIYTRDKGLNIKYSTRLDGSDWSEEATGTYDLSESSGNKGTENVKINNIRMRLDGPKSIDYSLFYRVYVSGKGWQPWASAGEQVLPDTEEDISIESLEIRIMPENATTPPESIDILSVPVLTGEAYTEGNGWMNPILGRTIRIGTENQNLRLEAFKLSTNNPNVGLSYQAYVEGMGWLDPTTEGNIIGTTDESRRLEAIRIELTGEQAGQFDIYYRVHVEDFGWLDWANNGQVAGTLNQDLRIESIQVKILPKGSKAPGKSEVPSLIAVDETEGQILKSVNQLRKENNLTLLTGDGKLHEAAVWRSEEISDDYSHTRPNGENYHTILDEVEYRNDGLIPALGENIIATDDPVAAFESFSKKQGSQKVLLTDYYRYLSFAPGYGTSVLFLTDTPSLTE